MVSVQARRTAVAYAIGRALSQRRACTLLKVARSALGYRSRKVEKDAPVLGRMSELARQYPRYGYRRIRIFLGRDGHTMSASRAYRLWQAARLQVPRRRPRKRIAAGRAPCPDGCQPGVELRLRVRLVRQRTAAQVPDGDRRMDQGGAGDRGRWAHSLGTGDRGAGAARVRARSAAPPALRQRAR